MQVCGKCGNEIGNGDLFCTKCGSRIEHVCIKCGHPYSVGDKFCEVCGNKLSESEDIVYTATSDDNTQISTRRKHIILILAVIIAVFFSAIGVYHYLHQKTTDKITIEQTIKDNGSKSVEQAESNNNVTPPASKIVTLTGVIKGKDVIVRAEASITASVVDYLDEGDKVTILDKQKCEDENAAIINVPTIIVKIDGDNILLKKGQAVKIISLDGNIYKSRTEINKRMVDIYTKEQEIRKIYGEVWYKVRLANSKVGWIYGDYVELKGKL